MQNVKKIRPDPYQQFKKQTVWNYTSSIYKTIAPLYLIYIILQLTLPHKLTSDSLQVLKSLLMSRVVESGVLDKGNSVRLPQDSF